MSNFYRNVIINDFKTFDDWGLILKKTPSISAPEPQLEQVEIPARNGLVDMSDVITGGKIKYRDRTITLHFLLTNVKYDYLEHIKSEIINAIHGQKAKIIFEDDPAFYWYGRIFVNGWSVGKGVNPDVDISISASVYPYKLSITSSVEDWLWDSFDFETGVVNELNNLSVDQMLSIEVAGLDINSAPIIITDNDMTLNIYKDNAMLVSKELHVGSQVLFDWVFGEGTYRLEFIGNGTVSIETRGGRL